MKNILCILPVLPWPLSSGGHQAVFNGIDAIKEDYNVFITYDAGRRDKYAQWHQRLKDALGGRITILPYIDNASDWTFRYRIKRYSSKFIDKFTSRSANEFFDEFIATRGHCAGFYNHINSIIEKYDINLVQVEFVENLEAALALPADVKKLFVHHELRFVRNNLYLSACGETPGRRILVETEKIKEIGLLNRYDGIITLSSVDADKLRNEGVRVEILPSFAIVNTGIEPKKNTFFNKTLSFVGPEAHFPNKEGLLWFLDNVWPLVLDADPEFKLKIIGQWTESCKKEWLCKYKNLFFCGFVRNLKDALFGTVLIVPLTIGSGIRMKILEAMSLGIPFVSTTIGAEGLPVRDMETCRIADSPADFCESVFSLQNAHLRDTLVGNAYELVSEQYSKSALKSNRVNLLNKILCK